MSVDVWKDGGGEGGREGGKENVLTHLPHTERASAHTAPAGSYSSLEPGHE